MPKDKFIRVGQETHQKLTAIGKKSETYDHIINRLLKADLDKEKILTLCDNLEKILDLRRIPRLKSGGYGDYAVQITIRGAKEKVEEIKSLLKEA